MCRFVIEMCRSSSNLVMVHWFLTELSLLNLEKNWNFQFPLSDFCLDAFIRFKLHVLVEKKLKIFSFRFLSLQGLHIFTLTLIYGYVIGICGGFRGVDDTSSWYLKMMWEKWRCRFFSVNVSTWILHFGMFMLSFVTFFVTRDKLFSQNC
jgi:hypothetical protein